MLPVAFGPLNGYRGNNFALRASANPPVEPRDGSLALSGIPWLPRMIDKSRLDIPTLTKLDLEYPCPRDQQLLKQLRLSGEEFQAITTQHHADEQIVSELRRLGRVPATPTSKC